MYLVLTIAVSYVMTLLAKRYEHGKKDKISEYNRKSSYFYNVMYDFGYGKDIRLLGIRDYIAELFMQYKELRKEVDRDIQIKNFKLDLVNRVFDFGQQILVYTYTIHMVASGRIDIADVTVYFASVAGFSSMFRSVISKLANLRAQDMYLKDYISFVEKKDKMRTEDGVHFPDAPYVIEFKNVSFKYPDTDVYILRNTNFTIKENERIAVVGANGSGKTTFIKLLCRLYRPEKGKILVNGKDISKYSYEEYMKLISVIFQDYKLFSLSIKDNLVFGRDVDREKIMAVLDKAGIRGKIETLPRQENTVLYKRYDKEAVELSGGELQKLAIARSIMKSAPVVIMDEPTSALDPIAEYEVFNKMEQLSSDRLAIFISHRLSSCKTSDRIVVFENGRIIECGTHKELIKLGGKYSAMWNVQAQYYTTVSDN